MITVVCVNVENYLGHGDDYVNKLCAMVARHLQQPYKFECITQSNKPGWWAKIDLFQPGRFSGRVLYLDLDSVIIGPLDVLVQSKGIVHLADWGWKKNDYGSTAMVWDAGEHEEIFEQYHDQVPKQFRGDQDWMTHLGGWTALPKGLCVSYRYESKTNPPPGASIICMHGEPKPHQITTGWVPHHWKI